MARRLTPTEKILREQACPKVGAVVAYGSRADGYRIGRVVDIDVTDILNGDPDALIVLTLDNGDNGKTRWLAFWDPFRTHIVPALSMEL